MSPAKRFLLRAAAAYVVLAVVIAWLWGPPGMSRRYLAEYEADHEQYLEITKREGYQLYLENPRLHPPDQRLQRDIAFVEGYEARAAFQTEQRRRLIFSYVFEFLNAGAVVLIAIRFGWKPLIGFLDQEIAGVRSAIERAQQAREAAARHQAEAQGKIDRLGEEKRGIEEQADRLIQREEGATRQAMEEGLAQIGREMEDRKRLEQLRGAMLIKRELVTQSVDLLAERTKAKMSSEAHEEWIDRFVQGLEKAG